MQLEDTLHLAYHVDREVNRKGIVNVHLRKEYGSAIVYMSESTKRPSAASNTMTIEVS